MVTHKEQRVVAWDRVKPRTGLLEEARLDYVTRDAITGQIIFADVIVSCAYSGYQPRQRARSSKDGLAACNAVGVKRAWDPRSGGELVPLAWEDMGRPAVETVTYMRSLGQGLSSAERSEVIRYAWQHASTLLHTGNAEIFLSALGF